ncbi:hypothetical protein KHA90_16725 [Flavobacterium psychroterrae]|uniref:DUF4625 domain-containing protein n=1 Tax=Flavobacterium psychroterrae TaxID=2133767 RepID=A0ABS5PEE9_9FLAO|nr:hypothetical protein [Flavobacterium psychroterrae]MBS7232664.1 hypothetical protein [Flavobacterium psychroterrae]
MKQLSQLVFIFLFVSCNSKADAIDNLTAPETFAFQLINKDNGENLFTNKILDSKKINVKNLDSGEIVKHSFVSQNNLDLIVLENVGRESETVNYSINVDDESIFELHLDAILTKEENSDYEYQNIEITNKESNLDKTSGVYKVFVAME